MRKFHDDNHANNRLSRCYIGYIEGGEKFVGRCERADLDNIHFTNGHTVPLQRPDVEITFGNMMGYVNTRTQCLYVTRASRRMWKAGIAQDNMIIEPIFRDYYGHRDEKPREVIMLDLFKGEYPKWDEALRKISDGRKAACAFSKKFAWGLHNKTKEVCLYYKNKPVGFWCKENKALIMGDVNSHLLQQLLEVAPDLETLI